MFKTVCRVLTKDISFSSRQITLPFPLHTLLRNAQFKRFFSSSLKDTKLSFEKYSEFTPLQRTLHHRLSRAAQEYQQLAKVFMNNETEDPKKLEETRLRMEELNTSHQVFEQLHNLLVSVEDINKMKKDPSSQDKDSQDLLNEELENCEALLEEVEESAVELLIPPEKYDKCSSINIEIRPGTGGSESSLFADDLLNMYQAYMGMKGWTSKVTSYMPDTQIGKGCKFGQIKANGQGIYKHMKCESGVHKVIRVPETEKMGRLHSSTASVIILPEVPMTFQMLDKDLKFEYMRSSGAGVNLNRATHVPTGLSVLIQDERTQHTNKARAVAILKEKVFALEFEKNREKENQRRKAQNATGDRSDKIRTYNFPQTRITDHRFGLTLFGIEKMLKGELLEEFIEGYQKQVFSDKITALLEDEIEEGKKE